MLHLQGINLIIPTYHELVNLKTERIHIMSNETAPAQEAASETAATEATAAEAAPAAPELSEDLKSVVEFLDIKIKEIVDSGKTSNYHNARKSAFKQVRELILPTPPKPK